MVNQHKQAVWDAIHEYVYAGRALERRRASGELMNADFIDAKNAAADKIDKLLDERG